MFLKETQKNMQKTNITTKISCQNFDVCKNFKKTWEISPLSQNTLSASASGIKMQGFFRVRLKSTFTQQGHVMYHVAAASYALKFLKMSGSIITWRSSFLLSFDRVKL